MPQPQQPPDTSISAMDHAAERVRAAKGLRQWMLALLSLAFVTCTTLLVRQLIPDALAVHLRGAMVLLLLATAVVASARNVPRKLIDVERFAVAGLVTGWLVTTVGGIFYGFGFHIAPDSTDVLNPTLSSAMERMGRFIFLGLPIAPLCAILTVAYRRKLPLQQTMQVVLVPVLTATICVVLSGFVSELGLATWEPLPDASQEPDSFRATHKLVRMGTMNALYPAIALFLCVLASPALARHLSASERRGNVIAWIATAVATLTILAIATWSSLWPGSMFKPGAGLGVVVVMVSLAISIPGAAALIWRKELP